MRTRHRGLRVFKPTYLDSRRKTQELGRWYVQLKDSRGIVRRIPALTDHGASEEFGRKLEALVSLRIGGRELTPALAQWLESLPIPLREKLARLGFIDTSHVTAASSLEALLDRFTGALQARERTGKHVKLVRSRAWRVFEGCGFKTWSDLDGLTLEQYLHRQRTEGKQLSGKSSNHTLAACKQFTRWCVEQGIASRDPFAIVRPVNARLDVRRERRALSDEELVALIETTHSSPDLNGMAGPLRALVYRLAAETGLRANEIQSIRAGDFDLGAEQPHVALPATATKNRREAWIPLRPDTASDVAPYLRGKLPAAPALPLPRFFDQIAAPAFDELIQCFIADFIFFTLRLFFGLCRRFC